MGLFDKLFGNEPDKYSQDWYESLSDDELDEEREAARLDYCNPELDDDYRASLYDTLHDFDDEISKRAWGDKEPGYPTHSEHGWYLSEDD